MTRSWWWEVCPTCALHDGFHDDGPHAVARSRIPRELILPAGWLRDEDANNHR